MATPSDPELQERRQNQENILQGTPKINFDNPIDHAMLSGRTAIITGGASGIGHGIAQALVAHGARVAVLDLTWPPAPPAPAPAAGGHLHNNGTGPGLATDGKDDDRLRFFRCDVSDWDSLLAAFRDVLVWSRDWLDMVITSAGLRSHNIRDLLLQEEGQGDGDGGSGGPARPPSAVFDVNLVGTYYTAYLSLWYFRRLGAGQGRDVDGWRPQLLFLGSLAGYVDQPLSADYCASKHGVRGLWKSVRAHGGVFGGAQMNMLAPTFVNNRQGSSKRRGSAGFTPGGDVSMAEVEDVVAGALRCLCDVKVDGQYLLSLGYPAPRDDDDDDVVEE